MSKTLSKHIAAYDYFDKALLVLSTPSGSVSFALFATIIGATFGITSPSPSLMFKGIAKKLLKTIRKKKKKHNKIVLLTRSKLNSIENIIPQALIDNEIKHEDYTTIIKEEGNHCELK